MWRGGRDSEGYKLAATVGEQEMGPPQPHEEDTETGPAPIKT